MRATRVPDQCAREQWPPPRLAGLPCVFPFTYTSARGLDGAFLNVSRDFHSHSVPIAAQPYGSH